MAKIMIIDEVQVLDKRVTAALFEFIQRKPDRSRTRTFYHLAPKGPCSMIFKSTTKQRQLLADLLRSGQQEPEFLYLATEVELNVANFADHVIIHLEAIHADWRSIEAAMIKMEVRDYHHTFHARLPTTYRVEQGMDLGKPIHRYFAPNAILNGVPAT